MLWIRIIKFENGILAQIWIRIQGYVVNFGIFFLKKRWRKKYTLKTIFLNNKKIMAVQEFSCQLGLNGEFWSGTFCLLFIPF